MFYQLKKKLVKSAAHWVSLSLAFDTTFWSNDLFDNVLNARCLSN